jgi:hypothetical protein
VHRQVALCVALLAAPPAAAAELARYRVTISADLARAEVEVRAPAPRLLVSWGDEQGAMRLDAATLANATLVEGRIQRQHAEAPIRYAADIRPRPSRPGSWTGSPAGALALTDPRLWLWFPAGMRGDDTIAVEFVLPEGIAVATPWAQRAGPGPASNAFTVPAQLLDAQGLVAFGALSQRSVTQGGATLRLSIASRDAAEVARFGDWAEAVWRAARSTVAAPPGMLEQLLVVPVAQGREAVPWGEVRRGTGNSVLVLVKRDGDARERREDWTLFHELAHLFHPYFGGDKWLAEGLASYYQNLLRAEAGVITPELAWQRLAEGLARGARGADAGKTVEEGGRMVTYWVGAALALEWDIGLRRATGGKDSLSQLLSRFTAAHLPARNGWEAREFATALDRLAPAGLPQRYFSQTLERTLAQRGFPEYLGWFAIAGVDPATGKVRADAPPELAALMRPRTGR